MNEWILVFYVQEPLHDYESRHSAGLRINFAHQGIFNMPPMNESRAFFAFLPHRNMTATAGIWSRDLKRKHPCPNWHGRQSHCFLHHSSLCCLAEMITPHRMPWAFIEGSQILQYNSCGVVLHHNNRGTSYQKDGFCGLNCSKLRQVSFADKPTSKTGKVESANSVSKNSTWECCKR